MPSIKSTTVYTNSPSTKSDNEDSRNENRKLSFWLEKLHIQGEEMRKDKNRREEQSKHTDHKDNSSVRKTDGNAQNLTQLGINVHTRNAATKSAADRKTVDDLVKKSNRRIISITSQFPWDIFPNTIDVEESRVTFKFSQFLASQSHSVDIKDISNVFIETSMFFSTLQVVSRTFVQNDIKIGKLNNAKALQVKRIIEGLRTFAENNINTSNYEINDLIAKIGEFHNKHVAK
jgi:hypothetical protein